MALQVIQKGLCNVSEYYGTECTLYYPGLYAGQTDLVGVHKGQDAIMDFKQTNKPKKREWIEDYCLQLAAYAMAHNFIYKTSISKGIVMMCSKDNFYQEFVIEGLEFQKHKHNFLRRVDEYYKGRSKTNMYHKTSGDMKEMWRKKWYDLVKIVGRKLDESKRLSTNSREIH
jgi:genome maintenance exonuclease 1